MKNYLPLPLIVFLLLTAFVFIGCGAKEVSPTSTAAEVPAIPEEPEASAEAPLVQEPEAPVEAPLVQEPEETDESPSPEAEMVDESPPSPEQETLLEAEPEEPMPTVEIPSGSVLHLIPEQAVGLIYCPSLAELDNRINMLAMDLMPTAEPPEVLAQILANTFGAGFESLAELEEIGLDLNQDFAIFMTSLKPVDLSATVHLTEPEAMLQVIEAESEGSAPTQYNGVTYWSATGASGNFAIIENTLIFSQSAEVCESVIDTYNGTKQSVTANPGYNSFLMDVSEGTAQLAVHFDLESVVPAITASLKGEFESTRDALESDTTAMSATPLLAGMFDFVINMLDQVKSLSATLEVEGTDVQLDQLLKFKTGSKIQNTLKDMNPHQLALLNKLPNLAFVNGGFQGKPEFLIEMSLVWFRMLNTDAADQADLFNTVVEQAESFYGALADEWAFTANYGDSIIPDYMVVYGLKDEQKARTYMEETFLEQIQNSVKMLRGVAGDMPQLSMYDGAHQGTPIMHNDVEIKSYVFPNFSAVLGDMPASVSNMVPKAWEWHYAFHDNQLFLAIGGPELIKTTLDRQTETGETLAENLSYQKLAGMLGTDNNLLLAVSPMTAVKGFMPIMAAADPDAAAGMQMLTGMLMNIPETYSIGFAAKAEENGIRAKLLFILGDFKQLIQMIMMMQGMGQMQ